MDRKRESIRRILGLFVFVLGVSLTLWNLSGLAHHLPADMSFRVSEVILKNDYQRSRDFQQYISKRLEDFLAIAIYGCPTEGWSDDTYSAGFTEQVAGYSGTYGRPALDGLYYKLEEQKTRLTKLFLNKMEQEKSLLYNISYGGRKLYANADFIGTDGKIHLPEGYNFLLYFNGEKVRIVKDGQELDVYGDGVYREDSDWYVPGYRNLPVNNEMKKAVVCIAAAKNPELYTAQSGESGEYREEDDTLYWIQYKILSKRKPIFQDLAGLAVGLGILTLSWLYRKERRETVGNLAALQGKIWVECKLLLLAAVLFEGVRLFAVNAGSIALEEISSAYTDSGLATAGEYAGRQLSDLRYMPAWFWVVLFWTIYLTVNDLRHNGEVWRQGLIARCYGAFSARELKLPLARRMVHRNAFLFGTLIFCGILILTGAVFLVDGYGLWWRYEMWQVFAVCVLVLCCLFLGAYLVGVKNVGIAREVDALSERIGEIYGGDYNDSGKDNAGHSRDGRIAEEEQTVGNDLGVVMTQLENIGQGMAGAVEEQMKSERMKVELIANVSHDIRTPLTSIISYVQLLKEEEGLPEHVKDYIRILDEKSRRLKNMVEDVFAVSKAASGELPVNMEELDFGKLLRQTLADMDEEIQDSKVFFRTELPDAPVMIMADGQRMYRVFQNLFQNALKYSLDGSRVYVALKAEGAVAVASVKNISRMELDGDKNFTERFVRGDESRTDGGSGLGLSIARSFTEACGGKLELEFNADLFIVKVSFQQVCGTGIASPTETPENISSDPERGEDLS